MENKLEQLLNSLVEAGWKPRGLLNEIEYIHAFNDVNQGWRVEISYGEHGYYKSLRQIASRESNLWQFACENGMVVNEKLKHNWVSQVEWGLDVDCRRKITPSDYTYRLIESALKDESELEDFLLQNINVDVDGRG